MAQAPGIFAKNTSGMEQKKDIELIESQAFRMGKKSEAKEMVSAYAETSEERECFCF